jgi:hypothetical protein
MLRHYKVLCEDEGWVCQTPRRIQEGMLRGPKYEVKENIL